MTPQNDPKKISKMIPLRSQNTNWMQTVVPKQIIACPYWGAQPHKSAKCASILIRTFKSPNKYRGTLPRGHLCAETWKSDFSRCRKILKIASDILSKMASKMTPQKLKIASQMTPQNDPKKISKNDPP